MNDFNVILDNALAEATRKVRTGGYEFHLLKKEEGEDTAIIVPRMLGSLRVLWKRTDLYARFAAVAAEHGLKSVQTPDGAVVEKT